MTAVFVPPDFNFATMPRNPVRLSMHFDKDKGVYQVVAVGWIDGKRVESAILDIFPTCVARCPHIDPRLGLRLNEHGQLMTVQESDAYRQANPTGFM